MQTSWRTSLNRGKLNKSMQDLYKESVNNRRDGRVVDDLSKKYNNEDARNALRENNPAFYSYLETKNPQWAGNNEEARGRILGNIQSSDDMKNMSRQGIEFLFGNNKGAGHFRQNLSDRELFNRRLLMDWMKDDRRGPAVQGALLSQLKEHIRNNPEDRTLSSRGAIEAFLKGNKLIPETTRRRKAEGIQKSKK